MRDGKIVEHGSHDQLMESNGEYAGLQRFSSQDKGSHDKGKFSCGGKIDLSFII